MGCMQNLMLLQTGLKMLKLVLFTACALAAAAAPAPILPAASEVQMSSCLHYMEDLWFDLAEETGKPKNISQSPTSVFCIPDYDIAHGVVRTDPAMPTEGCFSMHKFTFEWSALRDNEKLVLEKSYVSVFASSNTSILAVQVAVQLVKKGAHNSGHTRTVNQAAWQAVSFRAEVQQESVGLLKLEVEIGPSLEALWGFKERDCLVEVWVKLEMNCSEEQNSENSIKLSLTDTLGLDKTERESCQPFLVVFADDPDIRSHIESETDEYDPLEYLPLYDWDERTKRSPLNEDVCDVKNLTVIFRQLGFVYIVWPLSANVKACTGSCSYSSLVLNPSISSLHANIISSTLHDDKHPHPDSPLCCAPVQYSSLYMMNYFGTYPELVLRMDYYEEMVVEDCGCR